MPVTPISFPPPPPKIMTSTRVFQNHSLPNLEFWRGSTHTLRDPFSFSQKSDGEILHHPGWKKTFRKYWDLKKTNLNCCWLSDFWFHHQLGWQPPQGFKGKNNINTHYIGNPIQWLRAAPAGFTKHPRWACDSLPWAQHLWAWVEDEAAGSRGSQHPSIHGKDGIFT